MSQLFNHNGKWVTLEQYQKLLNPIEESISEDNSSIYSNIKFNDLKKLAKEKGIKINNTDKAIDIISLLEQYDALKDGDIFQGQITKFATQEFITENELEDSLKVGDLFFVPEVE